MIPKLHYRSQASSIIDHLQNIQKACSCGVELVQLDLDHIPVKDHFNLAEEVIKITAHFQTRLVIKTHYKIAHEIKADGIFIEPKDHSIEHARKHLYAWQTIGATAHTFQDCKNLISNDVDYIALGPYKAINDSTITPLGINGYTAIVDALETSTPILGYGNVTTEDVNDILETGVSGLLVAQGLHADFNSIKKFNQLLGASAVEEMRHSFK